MWEIVTEMQLRCSSLGGVRRRAGATDVDLISNRPGWMAMSSSAQEFDERKYGQCSRAAPSSAEQVVLISLLSTGDASRINSLLCVC